MGGNDENGKKMLNEIKEKMRINYIKELLFSKKYQLFTLELFLNIINSLDNKNNNLPVFFKNFSFISLSNNIVEGEDALFRNFRPTISNIERYITKGKIKLLKL